MFHDRYLGWYSEFHYEFNPLVETSKLFHLVGLSDYNEALVSSDPSAYTIVLRIETFELENLCKSYQYQITFLSICTLTLQLTLFLHAFSDRSHLQQEKGSEY